MKKHKFAGMKVGILIVVAFLSIAPVQIFAADNEGGDGGLNNPGSGTGAPIIVNPGSGTGAPTTANPGSGTGAPTTNNPGSGTGQPNTFFIQNPLSSRFNSIGGIVQGFLEIFSYLVILLAVLMLIWVGLQFILAQGNPDKLKELKNWLLWIVVGVAVVIGARIIVTVVISTLNSTGVVSPGVIQNANNAIRGN